MPTKGYRKRRNNIIDVKFYNKFKEDTGIEIDYATFRQVIINSNREIAKIIIEGNDGFRMPRGLGVITVNKYKAPKSAPKAIDWKNSNELGKRVYHLNLHSYGFLFSIKWFRIDITKLAFAGIYKFKASRDLSRAVAKRGKETNGAKYYTWQYNDFYEASRIERYMLKRDNKKNK